MDSELRRQVLRACARDKVFLRTSWRDITPANFPEIEEQIIAEAALTFYSKYEQPIGSLLRSAAEDLALAKKIGAETKKKLKDLLDLLQGSKMELVPVQALQDRVKALKKISFYEHAVDEILEVHEKGQLTPDVLSGLVERANKELRSEEAVASDYLEELENRIEARELFSTDKLPKLMIDPLDEKICAIGKGHTGLVLAPYSAGKGLFLVHIDISYAMQGMKVWHITLEDPKDLVESRLDSNITGIPMAKLHLLPKKLRKRFRRLTKQMHGRIRVTDGTAGGWTISQVERGYEQLKQEGFEADAIVIDYDDYIVCERQFKGESVKRLEFDDIYRRLTQLAAKLNVVIWTAAQGTRGSEGKKMVTGKDAAEDISKIRKVFLAIGVGRDPDVENMTWLYVCRHRLDRSRFGVSIMSNFANATFYDRESTLSMCKN